MEFSKRINEIQEEIYKGIIGQKDIIDQVLMTIFAGGNVLLEGVPGLGKTELVKTIGQVLDLDFSRIQFTPDLMPADVVGTNIISKNSQGSNEFNFSQGPIFSNIVLADEINRATPKTQSAMLQAMQEKAVTVGTSTYQMEEPFFVMATQNPIEMEGTYPLPEAQMDRFLFKLDLKFPQLDELQEIIQLTTKKETVEISSRIKKEDILKMRGYAKDVPIAESVLSYAMKLVMYTHPESESSPGITKKYIRFGASPRGAQAIIKTAKVRALLKGRFNVSFDDIKAVAYPALRHRVMLNFEGISEGYTTDGIITEIINSIEI